MRSATQRFTRILYLAVGATGTVFGLLALESVTAQAYGPLPVGSFIIWGLVTGLPAVLCASSQFAPLRVLRAVTVTYAAVVLVDVILWAAVRPVPLPGPLDVPWIISLTAVPSVGLAVAATRGVIWSYALAVCVLDGALRATTSSYHNPLLLGVEDALYSALMQTVFIALTLVTRAGAATLDLASATARQDSARQAANLAARRARLTVDALVHDSVISTLLVAGRSQARPEDLSRHAAKTLALLDSASAPVPDDGTLTLAALQGTVKELVASIAPDTELRIEIDLDSDGSRQLPAPIVSAMVGATGEALRNSVAYAGGTDARAVTRVLTVRHDPGEGPWRVEIALRDDGVGFEPAEVPALRMGISHSILGRMLSVPGGQATVSSAPGRGAEVVLSWSR